MVSDRLPRFGRESTQGARAKGEPNMTKRIALLKKRDERGATAVEYGLMVALIAVVIIAAVTLLGQNLDGVFNAIAAAI